MSYISLRGGKL